MKRKVIVSGLNVVDLLITLPKEINIGGKQQVDDLIIQGGAPAGNAASVMAQLGLQTSFIGYYGESTLNKIALGELERCNVDTSLMIRNENHDPAVALVEVNPINGERTVFYSLNNYQALEKEDINNDLLDNTQPVFVDGYDIEGNIALLTLAKERNIPTVLDIETGERAQLIEMLALGSHCILPLEGAQFIAQSHDMNVCFEYLASITSGQIIITDGGNGSWANTPQGIHHQAAFKTNVVDTTGCGDAFHGAYAFALLSGRDLPARMQFASAYASIVAQYLGGRTFHPSEEQVVNFINSNY
ncbi:PfkB family carbohydrate kinase [Colwellia sp. MSW7]|uniref:PfkB family carbohydrate kinase n=1 Tax=Colwellia maritima TaxID=2912588 RepID=A0ABS9X1E4_9GAMM|nr:PfkB family carbohydrate kinase [Colwellia maritima]MCI2283890.1 PfkB family carbohydrate kinase [Colwellia maritima]